MIQYGNYSDGFQQNLFIHSNHLIIEAEAIAI